MLSRITKLANIDYVLLAAVAFATLIGVFFVFKNTHLQLAGDGLIYNTYAQSLTTRGRFELVENILSDRRDPGFPLYLALLYKLFRLPLAHARMFQVVILTAIPLATYGLAKQLFESRAVARLAAIAVAGFYPLAWYASILYLEAWLALLLLLPCYFFVRAIKEGNGRYAILSGLFFGVAILSRSLLIYFPILFSVIFLVSRAIPAKKAFALLALFCLCSYAVVMPWMYRNYQQFGSFSVSEQSGPVLYFAIQRAKISNEDLPKVFVANALGDFIARKWFGSYDRFTLEEGDYGAANAELDEQGVSEQERDKILIGRALDFIREYPIRYLLIVPPIEFLKLHTPIFPFETMQGLFSDPTRHSALPDGVKVSIILGVRALYLVFFAFALYGLVKSIGRWRQALVIVLLLGYLVGGYSLLHGIPRYAVPLFPFYIIFFSFGLRRYVQLEPSA